MVGRKQPINGNRLYSENMCFQEFLNLVRDEKWLDFKLIRDNDDLLIEYDQNKNFYIVNKGGI